MRFSPPELASWPFQNLRPVRRLSVVMWVLGGALLAFNIWLYGTHVASLGDDLDRLEELETRMAAANQEVRRLEGEAAGLQLTWQNQQAEFLNHLIDQRTFSWSDLIDRLTEVLPREVRLGRLTPRIAGGRSARADRSSDGDSAGRVILGMAGSAADDEALLKFIDQLFEHPSFDNPRLAAASRGDGGEVSSFTLAVAYLPQAPADEEADGDTDTDDRLEAAGSASPPPADGAGKVSE